MKAKTIPHFASLFLAASLCWAVPAHADVALRGPAELEKALKIEPPCCVIDARSEDSQRKQPLADALRYRLGLSIVPTASVVVLGDNDKEVVKIAEAIAKQHPGKVIYAVKGGVSAWRTVLHSLEKVSSSSAGGAPAGMSFVIPHNTCETGTPLQILSSKPATKP